MLALETNYFVLAFFGSGSGRGFRTAMITYYLILLSMVMVFGLGGGGGGRFVLELFVIDPVIVDTTVGVSNT